MQTIDITDYLKKGRELRAGFEDMEDYIEKEGVELGRCPVCIAERIINFTRELKGPVTRGRRLACLKTIREREHTCGGSNGTEKN